MSTTNCENKKAAFERLLVIMDELREKCPWDRKQTMDSLRHLTIEETYELSEAIIEANSDDICEELGDLMLHLVFYAKIGEEKGWFDASDVMNRVCDKLIKRHPHIYGDVIATTDEEVKQNWEQIKLSEGKKSILQGVPKGLPSLVKAYRIQDKAKQVGFEWENAEQVWAKVEEETLEFKEAIEQGSNIEEEYGDLMFSMINMARFLKVDPEAALEKTNRKFIKRFQFIEEQAAAQSRTLNEMTLAEMDAIWNLAKQKE